jgi:hypothetical protein
VAILEVQENVSAENVSVLRAGITKLLKSGKNKIILNLVDAKQVSIEVIRDVIKLHLVAAELKGEIALCGYPDLVAQAVRGFASPPPVKFFVTKEQALASMTGVTQMGAPIATGSQQIDYAAMVIDPSDPNAPMRAHLTKLENENKMLKAKVATLDKGELRKLRYENGVFQGMLSSLEEELKSLTKDRKKPTDIESIQTKLNQLENAMGEFLRGEGLLSKQE